MIRSQIAKVYADALIEAAEKARALDAVAKDASALNAALQKDPEIVSLLSAPYISSASRKAVIEKALEGKIHLLTLNMLLVMADKRRISLIQLVFDAILEKYDELSGVLHARVVTAVPLNAAGEKRFRTSIERKTGLRVVLEKDVRPEIIGGAAIVIGETRIDGTIAGALAKIKTELMKRFSHGTQD
jgi:F-type H+-transporting ATPase subunit delta